MMQEARYIYVYSKDGKKLAEFSNSTAMHSTQARTDLMTEPIVHIVSNGESTLNFDMFASSQKWQTIKDPENIYICGNRQYIALNAQSIVYDGETVHVTLVETWYLLKRVYVQAYNVDPGIEALDEHTVKILPKADVKNKLTVNGVQYDDGQVVDSRGVVMPRGSAGYALWALLKGTDWGLGVCDVLPDGFNATEDYGTFNVESDMKSVLENIQFVQSMYGGILDWDSKNKLLSLRDENKQTPGMTEEEFWSNPKNQENYGKKICFGKSSNIVASNVIKGSKIDAVSFLDVKQDGEGLPSPTNIRKFLPTDSVRIVLNENGKDRKEESKIPLTYSGVYDWNTGKIKSKVRKITLDGTERWSKPANGRYELYGILPIAADKNGENWGDTFPADVAFSGNGLFCFGKDVYAGNKLSAKYPTLEAWKAQLKKTPATIIYTVKEEEIKTVEPKSLIANSRNISLSSTSGDMTAVFRAYPDGFVFQKQYGFNEWHGFEIRKRKNLAAPPKITYDNDIITKLYPLGNGNLNIKVANDGKSYIENHSYTEAVYEGYLTNPNIYYTGDNAGQKTLKFWAERQLEKLCKPRMSIQYEIIDLRATPGFEHETFDVNHVVKAYYDDTSGKEVFEYKRIQELSYNYFFPNSDSTVVVGDKVANVTELFHQVYKKTESSVPTDQNGNLSGDNIYIEIPEFMLPDFGYESSWGGVGYGSLSEITQLHAYYEKQNADGLTQVEAGVDVLANEVKAQNESYTAFQKETTEKFTQSATTISQISDALSAQVNLEATHYEETKQSIVESNAEIRSYVDGDFAKQTLAAAYGYTDKQTQAVADSVASLTQYANNTFATISSIASFVTMGDVNGAVNRSEASIKQYADKRYASINLTARVAQTEANLNQLGGYVTVGADSVAIGAGGGHGIQITKDVISIYGNVYILNKQIYVDGKGYLRGR